MKERAITFFLLLIVGLASYSNCFNVFIPGDNYSHFYLFDKGFLQGLYESSLTASPYFSGFPVMHFFYTLFHYTPVPWVGLGIFFHVINAFLVYLITSLLLKHITLYKYFLCFFSALVFLLSPYQVESVLWGAVSIRWLFHALTFLWCIYILLLYFIKPTVRKIILIHSLFALALFSNETAFVLPIIGSVLFFFFKKNGNNHVSVKNYLKQIICFQIILIASFFILNKLYIDNWFWHGGTFEEIANPSISIKTGLKYLAKFFLFYRYLPYQLWDGYLRNIAENHLLLFILFFSIVFLLALILKKAIQTKKNIVHLIAIFFICFLFMLVPVLPLDSSFLSYYYPDRYGYIASAFFYPFLVISIYFLFPKKHLFISSAYVIICFVFLIQTTAIWKASNDYCNKLIQGFHPFLKYNNIYVLNETEYYKGVAAFRSTLAENIHYKYEGYPPEKIKIISGAYQDSFSDSIIFVSINETQNKIVVKSTPKQTPYFCTGGWPKSYLNSEYEVVFDTTGCSYEVTFKNKIPLGSVFLYINGGEWEKAEPLYNISSEN